MTSGACQEDDVMLAVRYVISVANKLGRPVSICLGIGTNLGGHNGANGLARYISYLSLLPKFLFISQEETKESAVIIFME